MSILAIDFGQKRIGLAITYYGEEIKPFGIFSQKDFLSRIMDLCEQEEVKTIVIGQPDQKLLKDFSEFVNKIKKELKMDPVMVDETLSSFEAQKTAINSGRKKSSRKNNDDLSAVIILENYLEKLKK